MNRLIAIFALLLVCGCSTVSSIVESENENEVIFYTTHGYLDGDEWVIPMRIHVHHPRDSMMRFSTWIASQRFDLSEEEKQIFRTRVDDIVADSEWRERVEFVFSDDPEQRVYRLKDSDGNLLRTDLNGIKEGTIRIDKSRADSLLQFQNSERNWLAVEAVSENHTGNGKIQLIEPEGLSVISDIDDTIKITELPAGSRVVVQNTFFKDYEAAPGMVDLYSEWSDATFHYVTGAPWQLYKPLKTFITEEEQGFPLGSFHMKNLRKNYFNLSSWRDLRQLVTGESYTVTQKSEQISHLFETFPDRKFILVGDSGEHDPEVYRNILERYPEQVYQIYIRDVINDREYRPERLEGMTIIPAETVTSASAN